MEKVQIRWIEPQHTGDDFDQIKHAMEVGDDEEAEKFARMTYEAIPEPPMTAADIIIENAGDAFENIAEAFGKLPHSILISRA